MSKVKRFTTMIEANVDTTTSYALPFTGEIKATINIKGSMSSSGLVFNALRKLNVQNLAMSINAKLNISPIGEENNTSKVCAMAHTVVNNPLTIYRLRNNAPRSTVPMYTVTANGFTIQMHWWGSRHFEGYVIGSYNPHNITRAQIGLG